MAIFGAHLDYWPEYMAYVVTGHHRACDFVEVKSEKDRKGEIGHQINRDVDFMYRTAFDVVAEIDQTWNAFGDGIRKRFSEMV